MRTIVFGFLSLLSAFGLLSCGVTEADSSLMFQSDANECKVLKAIDGDANIANKGYGTLTITHPEIVSYFTFTKVLGKFSQVRSILDQQEIVRRIIRSFLVKKVPGVPREQPLRPFVIPELLCPLLDAEQTVNASFCGSQFFSDQAAAIKAALAFLDTRAAFENFAVIDRLLEPLTFIKRPPRSDLTLSEQVVEARVIFGLRSEDRMQRKPATVILEFAGTSQKEFYESLVTQFLKFKDQNNADARRKWAQAIEKSLDNFLATNSNSPGHWNINQIRINELAFRDQDILWDFREYNFPSPGSPSNEFSQVPVANTPWVQFDEKDSNAGRLNPGFESFLKTKGLAPDGLNLDQSIDLFEEFLSNPKVKVQNSANLQTFVKANLNELRNDSGNRGSHAFAFHLDSNWMAPAGMARPGMKFFDEENNFSKILKESCQGCHVAASSIAKSESIDSLQGFYHVSPRKLPTPASEGVTKAGSNILSTFLLRETRLRFQSMLKLVGCMDATTPEVPDPDEGHSSTITNNLNATQRAMVNTNDFACANKASDSKITECTQRANMQIFKCASGHTELVRCLQPQGTLWLISCDAGTVRKINRPVLLNSCDMPLPSS